VRVKRDDDAFAVNGFRERYRFFNYCLMADVHSIENANGDGCFGVNIRNVF
jgi:hypothetical protein